MKGTKDSLVKVKRLAVLNLVLTAIVLVLDIIVMPRLFWGEHPDGEYIYEFVEDSNIILIMPIVINIVLAAVVVIRSMSDKLKVYKSYVSVSILGILVNIFQADLAVDTAVTHFDRMSLDGNIVAQAYVYINITFLIIGMISIGMVFVYGLLIKLSLTKKS